MPLNSAQPSLDSVFQALVGVARAIKLQDGSTLTVRAMDESPTVISQGDCPQFIFTYEAGTSVRMSFNDENGHPKYQLTDEIIGLFLDEAVALDQPATHSPRTAQLIDDFRMALAWENTLSGFFIYNTVSVGRYTTHHLNGVQYRGVEFRIKLTRFTA